MHPQPRVRDDRETPLHRDGTAGVLGLIWVRREAEYFLKQGWTTQITLKVLAFLPSSRTPEIFGQCAVGQGLRPMIEVGKGASAQRDHSRRFRITASEFRSIRKPPGDR